MRSTRSIVILAALTLALTPMGSHGKQVTPGALPPPLLARSYFPDRAALGDGWFSRQSFTSTQDLDLTVFQTYALRRYGGPGGARASLAVRPLVTEPGATLRGWALISDAMDTWAWDYEGGYQSRRDLAGMDPPDGCLDAQRITGMDDTGFPVAVTACVTDRVVLVAVFSGELPQRQGPETSDHLIALSLASAASA